MDYKYTVFTKCYTYNQAQYVEATLEAGNDLRHGLIGSGVYASHGYERSHRDGAENTLKVLIGYAL